MSSFRQMMMTTAMAMGVLAAAGIGAAGEVTSLVSPQLTIPAAGSTQGPVQVAPPNDLGAELTPLPATPRVPWSAAAAPVAGSTEMVGTAALAQRPNSLAPNG
jgi:hypothetical protein